MKKTQEKIVKKHINASAGYAKAGLDVFFETKSSALQNLQASIGNLTIAIELLLKGFIAQKHLLLLYKGVPLELKCALCAPTFMPSSFRKNPYKVEVESSNMNAIEINDAIEIFGYFYPDFKKRFSVHLKLLSKYRNICVHGTLPDFHMHEARRIVFLFLSLVLHVRKQNPELLKNYTIDDDKGNACFLKNFDEELHKKVHNAIEKAKEKSKVIDVPYTWEPDDWETYPIECPVCKSDGILYGETEATFDGNEEDGAYSDLAFNGESFECQECGLTLDDYDEMRIAGIDSSPDRTDEMDKWLTEYYIDQDDYQ